MSLSIDADPEAALRDDVARFALDPLGFAVWAFPWGKRGTILEGRRLEGWQQRFLDTLGKKLRASAGKGERARLIGEAFAEVIQMARVSGKGIGKSALVAILILWAMATFEGCRGVVTANTDPQLRTKTWPELSKWLNLLICRHWFDLTGTALYAKSDPQGWRIDALPWNDKNPEAFAGLHNQGKRLIVIMDEASAIPDVIHETVESTLTDVDTEMLWFMFGNPTRNTGRFRDVFRRESRFAEMWDTASIDSREVSITNKQQIERVIKAYGDDSDYVRVYVKGQFPRTDQRQFIGMDLVEMAMTREAHFTPYDALVLACDIGRQGDPSVLYPRRGRDARTLPYIELREDNLMIVASRIVEELSSKAYDICFIDMTGMGAGVYDRVRDLTPPCPVIGVEFAGKPDYMIEEDIKVLNKRVQMWANMRAWLRHGALPQHDVGLRDELTGPEYDYNEKGEIVLESKKHMKLRGLPSPNKADALAISFAYPVKSRRSNFKTDEYGRVVKPKVYDTLSENWGDGPMAENWVAEA